MHSSPLRHLPPAQTEITRRARAHSSSHSWQTLQEGQPLIGVRKQSVCQIVRGEAPHVCGLGSLPVACPVAEVWALLGTT
eukprot:scaffold54545_cov17-Tisochrysis_lutea.AAC.2